VRIIHYSEQGVFTPCGKNVFRTADGLLYSTRWKDVTCKRCNNHHEPDGIEDPTHPTHNQIPIGLLKKYKSCTAPIGEYCSKHQCKHRGLK